MEREGAIPLLNFRSRMVVFEGITDEVGGKKVYTIRHKILYHSNRNDSSEILWPTYLYSYDPVVFLEERSQYTLLISQPTPFPSSFLQNETHGSPIQSVNMSRQNKDLQIFLLKLDLRQILKI